MKVYKFLYWTGPFENDISFNFSADVNQLNEDIVVKSIDYFIDKVKNSISNERSFMKCLDNDCHELIKHCNETIESFEKVLTKAEIMRSDWDKMYIKADDRIHLHIDAHTSLSISRINILEF